MKATAVFKVFYITFFVFPFLAGVFPLSAHASMPNKGNPKTKSANRALNSQIIQASWQNAEVLPGVVVVKYKEGFSQGLTQIQKSPRVQALGVMTEKKLFGKLSVSASLTKKGQSLEQIRVLSYASGEDPKTVAEALGKDDAVEYAEPYFVRRLFYVPNDPDYGSSWWLQNIQAALAWEVTTGDTTVIIGIIDTGVQWEHPDLAPNIKRNRAEIQNDGIDNDGNGYIDDVVGWDFGSANNYPPYTSGSGDNNPDERTAIHGTHCAGIAAAVTDNGVGVASVGFKSKILPVKVTIDSDQNNGIYFGYEGMLYAAERGAKIISCSWGGEGYSQAEQDVIDYITEVKGALVVAAAGNGDPAYHVGYDIDNSPVYPASYNNVLAIGATNSSDVKASFSNYGATACDLMAPGVSIWSTWKPGTYAYLSGTSMACPMVAGAAALVAARFPDYTGTQIAEHLRMTTDNIDAKNPGYAGKLGKGRLNVYNAITATNAVSVRLVNVELGDIDGDEYLSAGDTVAVTMTLRNMLTSVSDVSITVTPQSAGVSMLQNSFTVSSLGTLATYTDQSVQFVVDGSVIANQVISFDVTITASGGYVGTEQFSTSIQSSYLNFAATGSNIELTVNNRGNFGYNDYPDNTQGIGLLYRSQQMLYEGSLMIGTSAGTVEDVAREGDSQSADFMAKVPLKKTSGTTFGQEIVATFNDSPVSIGRLGIEISEHVYLFPSSPDTSYAIVGYVIRNVSGSTLTNLHVGLLMDWDVVSYSNNSSGYDAATKTLYTYHSQSNIHAGVTAFNTLAGAEIDGVGSLSSLDDQKKWSAMSGGIQTVNIQNTDIASFLSSGPFEISAGDSLVVGFGFVFGMGKNALLQNAVLASQKWDEIRQVLKVPDQEVSAFGLMQNYPNPFNATTAIAYQIPETVKNPVRVQLKVYDILGRLVKTLVDKEQAAGSYVQPLNATGLASGVYFYRLEAGSFVKTKKMVLVK